MREPTQEYLHECFDYVDGKLYWKVRPREHFKNDHGWNTFNSRYAGEEAGCPSYHKKDENERWNILLCNRKQSRSRLVWTFHNGNIKDDLLVDHKDGVVLNDRIENLRLVTSEENSWNKKKYKNNSSGVTGVYKAVYTVKGKEYVLWASTIRENGKRKTKKFKDFFEAVCHRKSWESNHPHITEEHGRR